LAPSRRLEDDFYGPPDSKEYFGHFLDTLGIVNCPDKPTPERDTHPADTARLAEFQRNGYYLAYVSECPIPRQEVPATSTIARLGPMLIRRIRFNYKPKHIAPLGEEILPLVETLKVAGMAPALILNRGLTLPTPGTGDQGWTELFQRAVSSVAGSDNLSLGYDRIGVTKPDRKLGAGGNS